MTFIILIKEAKSIQIDNTGGKKIALTFSMNVSLKLKHGKIGLSDDHYFQCLSLVVLSRHHFLLLFHSIINPIKVRFLDLERCYKDCLLTQVLSGGRMYRNDFHLDVCMSHTFPQNEEKHNIKCIQTNTLK